MLVWPLILASILLEVYEIGHTCSRIISLVGSLQMVASRVGFKIRFEVNLGVAMIKFLTNGALIREMMCYPLLRKYRCHVMTLPEVINLSGNASPISGGKRFDLHKTNRVNSFLRQWSHCHGGQHADQR
ncbi:hypothetical protein ACQJBY_001782 [Aegilops geniculata]